MDLSKVLEQLRRELSHLDAAILSLERLQAKVGGRVGPRRRVPIQLLETQPKPQVARRRQIHRGQLIE